jgi:hypothetical protein
MLQGWETTVQEHLPSPFPLHGSLHRAEQWAPRAREIQHAFEAFEAVGEGVVRNGEQDQARNLSFQVQGLLFWVHLEPSWMRVSTY